jgi:hypothetical protein
VRSAIRHASVAEACPRSPVRCERADGHRPRRRGRPELLALSVVAGSRHDSDILEALKRAVVEAFEVVVEALSRYGPFTQLTVVPPGGDHRDVVRGEDRCAVPGVSIDGLAYLEAPSSVATAIMRRPSSNRHTAMLLTPAEPSDDLASWTPDVGSVRGCGRRRLTPAKQCHPQRWWRGALRGSKPTIVCTTGPHLPPRSLRRL